jgi:hypothetical protein
MALHCSFLLFIASCDTLARLILTQVMVSFSFLNLSCQRHLIPNMVAASAAGLLVSHSSDISFSLSFKPSLSTASHSKHGRSVGGGRGGGGVATVRHGFGANRADQRRSVMQVLL